MLAGIMLTFITSTLKAKLGQKGEDRRWTAVTFVFYVNL